MGKTLYLLSQPQLVQAIKDNNTRILKQFYTANYTKIETWILKHNGSEKQAKDIYQEAFTTVWAQVKHNAFTPKNNTALQDYLYKVAKKKWKTFLRSKKNKSSLPLDSATLKIVRDSGDDYTEGYIDKLEIAMKAYKNLGQSCKQLLKGFYFDKLPVQDIASSLNMETPTVLHKKYQCMEKLHNMVLVLKQSKIEKLQ